MSTELNTGATRANSKVADFLFYGICGGTGKPAFKDERAYNTKRNQEEIAAIGAEAFIPFKRNHTGKQGGLWGEKHRQWREDQEYFLKNYHQRSNVETTIMMWKTSFGDSLRSKTEIAIKNELYYKLICHNLSCLIKAKYELGLGAEFLAASFQNDAAD